MKYRVYLLLSLSLACNSVTVVPIEDEDAGDAGADANTPAIDAASDGSLDAEHDALPEGAAADASDEG